MSRNIPVVILLNKVDDPTAMDSDELKEIL
jgi:hypothetical protein